MSPARLFEFISLFFPLVGASALRRQLNDASKSNNSTIEVAKGFNYEWNMCFELVSLVHADILECGENVDIDDLDKLPARWCSG